MKTTLAITALAATSQLTSAAILKRDFSQADVQNFVNDWQTDVNNVNNFLDGFFNGGLNSDTPDQLMNEAQAAKVFASDEPMELMRLGSLSNLGQQGVNAAMDLMQIFGPQVIDNVQKIIDNPGQNQTVQTAVDAINNARCFNVLPDLCELWPASFKAVGLDPNSAPLPKFELRCKSLFTQTGDTPACQGKEPVFV